MTRSLRSLCSAGVIGPSLLGVVLMAACAAQIPTDDDSSGGVTARGGASTSSAGNPNTSSAGKPGSTGNGGTLGAGGSGTGGSGNTPGSGGTSASGGTGGSGGSVGGGTTGGTGGGLGTGGTVGSGSTGGAGGTGGGFGTGGSAGMGRGGMGTGGSSTAGASTGGTSSGAAGAGGDPCTVTTVPSGGTPHASNNASGTAAGLSWTIWSNGSGGSITTYSTPAFSASWNNSGDFLARIGLQWNDTKTYDQYGTITATYSSKKTGSGGGYSYIGIYGWSTNPCVEWYIVDDSYNKMPVNPGNTSNKGTAMIDGGTYTIYSRATSGTGGSKCQGVSNWTQFYSVRQTARQCGTISITQHFDAWKAAGLTLGKMDQAQILVEVGGGSGSIDFPVANVTTTM